MAMPMPSNALALTRLLAAERSSLLRWIARIVGEPAAEDVTQSLYLRVQRVEDRPPIANKRAYLFQLAANEAWDQGRKLARQRRIQAEADAILWGAECPPAVDRVLIAREELARVMEAADRLSEPARTIFWLNRIQGLPQRDIAEQLGVSRTTVEKHIRRAMALLSDARDRA